LLKDGGDGMTKSHSLSALSSFNCITDLDVVPGPIEIKPREIRRSDLPVCWFESQYKLEKLTSYKSRNEEDILCRLDKRIYTRHLVRLILTFMTEQDLMMMVKVSRKWRILLMRN